MQLPFYIYEKCKATPTTNKTTYDCMHWVEWNHSNGVSETKHTVHILQSTCKKCLCIDFQSLSYYLNNT